MAAAAEGTIHSVEGSDIDLSQFSMAYMSYNPNACDAPRVDKNGELTYFNADCKPETVHCQVITANKGIKLFDIRSKAKLSTINGKLRMYYNQSPSEKSTSSGICCTQESTAAEICVPKRPFKAPEIFTGGPRGIKYSIEFDIYGSTARQTLPMPKDTFVEVLRGHGYGDPKAPGGTLDSGAFAYQYKFDGAKFIQTIAGHSDKSETTVEDINQYIQIVYVDCLRMKKIDHEIECVYAIAIHVDVRGRPVFQVMTRMPGAPMHSDVMARSDYYNNLDYQSLFDDSAPPIHHYESGLQLAQVHSNDHYDLDGEYYNGLLLGGVIGGGSVVMILVIFCIGVAFGMVICFGYQTKKELEERKDMDLRQ
eukprot:520841_1